MSGAPVEPGEVEGGYSVERRREVVRSRSPLPISASPTSAKIPSSAPVNGSAPRFAVAVSGPEADLAGDFAPSTPAMRAGLAVAAIVFRAPATPAVTAGNCAGGETCGTDGDSGTAPDVTGPGPCVGCVAGADGCTAGVGAGAGGGTTPLHP